jgi:enoyl-[acyl-carrier-protein] reductase (NADH)
MELIGRRILVTGVSRRIGIVYTLARAFADAGAGLRYRLGQC